MLQKRSKQCSSPMAINLMNKNKGAGTRIRRMFCCLEKRENEKNSVKESVFGL